MERTVCIYHGNCFDGMCAAWVVSRMAPAFTEFIAGNYGDQKLITNITQDCYENANINIHYILVDFSFPRELMQLMHSKAKSMLVLDHHKTAQADCAGLEFCQFDMDESGASLAWKHFFPGVPVPALVRYIRDRDLWRFEQPHSNAINAYIQSHEMSIDEYEVLYKELESKDGFNDALTGGLAIERYKATTVGRIVSAHRWMEIAGYRVPVVNSIVLMSEVGHALCQFQDEFGHPAQFGAYYFDRSDGMRQWGARSIGDFDVSAIAKKFGGGGHKNAAGWQERISEWRANS